MARPFAVRNIRFGVERLPAAHDAPRHQHEHAYVTLVLEGRYEQIAYAGRLHVEEGDVVLQPSFDCHADHMLSRGIVLLRIPWGREPGLGGVFRGCDLDLIRHAARSDRSSLEGLVRAQLRPERKLALRRQHWTDALADQLRADPRLRISTWSEQQGLAPETVSRGFRAIHGVGPATFRSELRARKAWSRITGSHEALSSIAAECGFADQAQMTRALRWFTGRSPAQLRRESCAAV